MTEPVCDIPVSALQRGSYVCVAPRSLPGWLISKATRSWADHAFIYLGEGLIAEATLRGVRVDQISRYEGRRAAANTGEAMTVWQRRAVCAKAESFTGMEYAYRDLILIGLRRLHLNWGWLRRILSDRDAVICSELVALSGDAGYLDWLCGTTPDLVTPAMLALRPGVQRVMWAEPADG